MIVNKSNEKIQKVNCKEKFIIINNELGCFDPRGIRALFVEVFIELNCQDR
jgi:hypothetical protein